VAVPLALETVLLAPQARRPLATEGLEVVAAALERSLLPA
jgi:hypothetical protein